MVLIMARRNDNLLLLKYRSRDRNFELTVRENTLIIKRKVLDPLMVSLISKMLFGKELSSLYITLQLDNYTVIKIGNKRITKAKRIARIPKKTRNEVINAVISALSENKNKPSEKVERKVFEVLKEKNIDLGEALRTLL